MPERVWTVRDALDWTIEYLGRKSIEEPRRSAEWLLSAATGLSRVELYAHFDRPLSPDERARFREGIERRAAGEPLQYVTGEMPFRHLVVRVRPGVFIPRPETEVLVDVGLAALPADTAEVLAIDLCTGSGAVAVSLAYEHPGATVYASDLNPLAVETTWDNAARAGVGGRVNVFEGDLFAPLPAELRGRVALVAANPPYIPLGRHPHAARRVSSASSRSSRSTGVTTASRPRAASSRTRPSGWSRAACSRWNSTRRAPPRWRPRWRPRVGAR